MSADLLLKVIGLTKKFPGVTALDGVDFQLRRGSVHAVCGENGAGKSTLMNILMGVCERDSGEIYLNGQPVNFQMPKHALTSGIAMIEQELNPIPDMTVAENMFLGREETLFGFWMDSRSLVRKADQLLAELGSDIDSSRKMKTLSLAQIQLAEIAKALSYDSDIIIMDEPTSAIGEQDADRLFRSIELLRSKGKGLVYVSHRLKEIFAVSDTVTVLRDGVRIGTHPTESITRSTLVNMMIGRKIEEEYIKTNTPTSDPVLTVKGLTKTGSFSDISLTVYRREVLGIFGLLGSGRSEFVNALFGVVPPDSGECTIFGVRTIQRSPRQAIGNGLALVTEDRKMSGLVMKSTVRDNIALPSLRRLSNGMFINKRREADAVQGMTRRFRIQTPSLKQLVARLSGGNQQKVVLAKWLLTRPGILLLDEPTRGIDVGAKREIYAFMSEYADQGNAVIMISSELPEVMGMSDRIIVFRNGRSVGCYRRGEVTRDELMRLASEAGHTEGDRDGLSAK